MSKKYCNCPPPPVTPGPSSYTPSRLYPDFWNNLRADGYCTYDYPGPVPAPFAPVYYPNVPPNCLVNSMNRRPVIQRRNNVTVVRRGNKGACVPIPTPGPAPFPPPNMCPCHPDEGFNPKQATTKVYRGTVTLLEAGDNVTIEEEKKDGIIKYTISSNDIPTQEVIHETQVEVKENTQKIDAIEEKLPELEVEPLTNDDIDDIFNLD